MKLTKEQTLKVLKVAAYAGVSAALGTLIAFLEKNPEAIGAYTAIVNVALVTVRQMLTVEE